MLQPETALEWSKELAELANKAQSLAGRLADYPGSEGPVAGLRQAAVLADDAREYLRPTVEKAGAEIDGTRAGADMH